MNDQQSAKLGLLIIEASLIGAAAFNYRLGTRHDWRTWASAAAAAGILVFVAGRHDRKQWPFERREPQES